MFFFSKLKKFPTFSIAPELVLWYYRPVRKYPLLLIGNMFSKRWIKHDFIIELKDAKCFCCNDSKRFRSQNTCVRFRTDPDKLFFYYKKIENLPRLAEIGRKESKSWHNRIMLHSSLLKKYRRPKGVCYFQTSR